MINSNIFWIKVKNSSTLKAIFNSSILGQLRKESIYEYGKANSYVFNDYFDDKKSFWVHAKTDDDVIELIEILSEEFSTPILAYWNNKYIAFNSIGKRILIEDEFANDYCLVASILEEASGYSFNAEEYFDLYNDNCEEEVSDLSQEEQCENKSIDNKSHDLNLPKDTQNISNQIKNVDYCCDLNSKELIKEDYNKNNNVASEVENLSTFFDDISKNELNSFDLEKNILDNKDDLILDETFLNDDLFKGCSLNDCNSQSCSSCFSQIEKSMDDNNELLNNIGDIKVDSVLIEDLLQETQKLDNEDSNLIEEKYEFEYNLNNNMLDETNIDLDYLNNFNSLNEINDDFNYDKFFNELFNSTNETNNSLSDNFENNEIDENSINSLQESFEQLFSEDINNENDSNNSLGDYSENDDVYLESINSLQEALEEIINNESIDKTNSDVIEDGSDKENISVSSDSIEDSFEKRIHDEMENCSSYVDLENNLNQFDFSDSTDSVDDIEFIENIDNYLEENEKKLNEINLDFDINSELKNERFEIDEEKIKEEKCSLDNLNFEFNDSQINIDSNLTIDLEELEDQSNEKLQEEEITLSNKIFEFDKQDNLDYSDVVEDKMSHLDKIDVNYFEENDINISSNQLEEDSYDNDDFSLENNQNNYYDDLFEKIDKDDEEKNEIIDHNLKKIQEILDDYSNLIEEKEEQNIDELDSSKDFIDEYLNNSGINDNEFKESFFESINKENTFNESSIEKVDNDSLNDLAPSVNILEANSFFEEANETIDFDKLVSNSELEFNEEENILPIDWISNSDNDFTEESVTTDDANNQYTITNEFNDVSNLFNEIDDLHDDSLDKHLSDDSEFDHINDYDKINNLYSHHLENYFEYKPTYDYSSSNIETSEIVNDELILDEVQENDHLENVSINEINDSIEEISNELVNEINSIDNSVNENLDNAFSIDNENTSEQNNDESESSEFNNFKSIPVIETTDSVTLNESYDEYTSNYDDNIAPNIYENVYTDLIPDENLEYEETPSSQNHVSIELPSRDFKELHEKNKKLSEDLSVFLDELKREKEIISNREEIIINREKKLKQILNADYSAEADISMSDRNWKKA